MPSTEIQARVRVLLYPEQDSTHYWPCPPGVSIQLKKKGPGSSRRSAQNLVTGLGSVTSSTRLETGSYQVTVTSQGFHLWTSPDLQVPAPAVELVAVGVVEGEKGEEVVAVEAEAGELLDIPLFPQPGRRLVVLRLVTDSGEQVPDATVTIAGTGPSETFHACSDGHIYAAAPKGAVTLHFPSVTVNGQLHCTQAAVVPYLVSTVTEVKPLEFTYWPAIQITANPTVMQANGTVAAMTGTSVTVEYQASPQDVATSRTKTSSQDGAIVFEYPFPGYYTVTVTPPLTWQNLPVEPGPEPVRKQLSSGSSWEVRAAFAVVPTQDIAIKLQLPPNQHLIHDADFEISYGTGSVPVTVKQGASQLTATVPAGMPLTLGLAEGAVLMSEDGPLELATPTQAVTPNGTVALGAQHQITITAVDEDDHPVPRAMVDIFGPDDPALPFRTVVTDEHGRSRVQLRHEGIYYVSEHYEGGQARTRQPVQVASNAEAVVRFVRRAAGGEALTDLSAYPVLTEEISTTGVPAPAGGAPGGAGPGAGYGQTVDQVMRDVLGWRPSGDVAGFQAALTGAFSLRDVEGHTEWTWQQRGYAVQADMGALTGAQASIYARAKNALDQVQPLLAGLTTINPALYPPQDLEAIRVIVTAELNELVSELAWEGGPRIQRVDELFLLLLGEGHGSFSPDPDRVGGQLGILRDRFGLTVDQIDTVDEERIVTNFRVIVEQVLALQASWRKDRELLSGVNARTSLGTILIWLSRGLEAVCESVGDLTFALDSVYIDAAQRQVIELRFANLSVEVPELPLKKATTKTTCYSFGSHEPPILLSDLLDWVTRASQDEGPRIVQGAGKDGVLAFEPVLDRLRILVHATRKVAHHGVVLPDGMRTPRVRRALQVLAAQLDEAASLARLVRREPIPQITTAWASPDPVTSTSNLVQITVSLVGTNIRTSDAAVLIAEDREDLPELRASLRSPGDEHGRSDLSTWTAKFTNPATLRNSAGTTWLVALVNENGTQSNQVEVVHVSHSLT